MSRKPKILNRTPAAPSSASNILIQIGRTVSVRRNRGLKITPKTAAVIIAIVGLAVFFSGLKTPYMGDDKPQIVDNPAVHSIANIGTFFGGGTFYNGPGMNRLDGVYYRPLMTTTFSLIYSIFGPQPFAFHLLQLTLHILGAFILFLVLRYFIRPALALILALVFLVHPVNSQAVYSIPAMQEPLYFLFGILALWLLVRYQDKPSRYLIPSAICLFVSLLAKETGIVFVAVVLIYTFLANRRRFVPFIVLSLATVSLYLTLKIQAVGLVVSPHNAPIVELSFWERMLNVPAILLFYITKFIFPQGLAQAYYWEYKSVSFVHVLLPLIVDLGVGALVIYGAVLLRKKASRRHFVLFLFFSLWLLMGLLPHLQIIPLDMTACETWFYAPLAGLLGMVGVMLDAFPPRLSRRWGIAIAIVIVGALGLRTALRGLDWGDPTSLAYKNIAVSREDYISENLIANELARKGRFSDAKKHAERSVGIYPAFTSLNTLGVVSFGLKDYPRAKELFMAALSHGGDVSSVYENLAALATVYGDIDENGRFVVNAVKKFPQDPTLWFYLAILQARHGNNASAKTAIGKAREYGYFNQYVYDKIMNNEQFEYTVDPRPW